MRESRGWARRAFIPLTVVLVFVLAACGGDEPEQASGEDNATEDVTAATGTESAEETEAPEAPQDRMEANIGVPGKSSAFFHTYVADAAGIFEQCGLDATIVEMQAPQIAAALEQGDINLGPGIGSVIRASFQGLPVRVVAVMKNGFDYSILASGITSAEELAGKTIVSAAPTSTPGVALRAALDDLGLTDEVEVVSAQNTAARVSLLRAGEVDASIINVDGALRLQGEDPNLNIVYRPEDFPPNPFTGLTATVSTIEENPDLVRRAISAYLATGRFILENPEETQAIYQEAYELTSEQAAQMYDLTSPLIVEDGMPTDELIEGEARLNSIALEREVTVDEIRDALDLSLIEGLEPTC